MHEIITRLCALFLLAGTTVPVAAEGTSALDVAAQRNTTLVEQFCNYCQDYTDAAVAVGPIAAAYKVGVGYPDEKQVAEVATSQQR